MPPAARITDMHTCPMQTPGLPPIPHAGGPVIGPGAPTVLIGKLPAAVMGDMCICTGPPDSIIKGSATRRRNSRRMPHGTDWRITVKQYKKNNGMSKRNLSRLIFGASLLPLAACLKDEATDGNATEQ